MDTKMARTDKMRRSMDAPIDKTARQSQPTTSKNLNGYDLCKEGDSIKRHERRCVFAKHSALKFLMILMMKFVLITEGK